MKTYTQEELSAIVANHADYLKTGDSSKRANLRYVDLRYADLRDADLHYADLHSANLRYAYLHGADLRDANLRSADLHSAYLHGANLRYANLRDANLHSADLRYADLRYADLHGANLRYANLRDANLHGADLPYYQIPEGNIIGYKKIENTIIKLLIPINAKRTGTLVERKCRAEYAIVVNIFNETKSIRGGHANYDYVMGEYIYPDAYNDDPRIECTNGIHFFLTREEAEAY